MFFAIETSCDETSTAVLTEEGKILSHIVVNQQNHEHFGGVVPEIASRSHLEILQKIIPKSLDEANIKIENIKAFSATAGPGLIGGLLVGSTFAKSMAIGQKKPFYPINHLEGHLLSPLLTKKLDFPYLAILLTGGHTQIYLVKKIGKYLLLGETMDDAIGESFDKVARLLELGYPGGPAIEKKAAFGNINAFDLPHPLKFEKSLNFSFSGIKTAVNLIVKKQKKINEKFKKDMSASFQNKIIEILIKRISLSLTLLKKNNIKIKKVAIVGGVAANKKINASLNKLSKKYDCSFIYPLPEFCGDNAAMIAYTCLEHYNNKIKPNIDFKADPRWALGEIISL